jgi:hypothetical protein
VVLGGPDLAERLLPDGAVFVVTDADPAGTRPVLAGTAQTMEGATR